MIRRFLLTASLLVLASDLSAMPPLAERPETPPLLMSATASAPPPSEAMIAPKSDGTFAGDEAALKAALATALSADAKRNASIALARFYATHDFFVEALAAMQAIDPPPSDDASKLLVGELEYRLGRYDAALSTLEDERLLSAGAARSLRAMTLARLGAYAAAKEAFACGEIAAALGAECELLRAETALATGDLALAEQSLADARRGASGALVPEAALIGAKLDQAKGRDGARQLRALAGGVAEPAASRAALALAMNAYERGDRPAAEALGDVRTVALRWSGGAFERETLSAIAALSEKSDVGAAFSSRRALAENHAQSDAAAKARGELTTMLTTLLDRDDLSAGAAAQIFYENIDFAPPGQDGDVLIRRVAGELARLDLVADAAELLEHQVFNRLRGAERSEVAAELAELYLKDRRPGEALRVIRATRIAGLDDETNARRKVIEATALERTGALDGALQLLADDESAEALRLRAEIYWDQQAWLAAADAYREIVLTAPAPLAEAARADALRAAAAYLKAGAEEDFAAFRTAASASLAGTREGELLNSLGGGAATANFLGAYRELYGAEKS